MQRGRKKRTKKKQVIKASKKLETTNLGPIKEYLFIFLTTWPKLKGV